MDQTLLSAIEALITSGGELALWAILIIKGVNLLEVIICAIFIPMFIYKLIKSICDSVRNNMADNEYRKILQGLNDAEAIKAVPYPPGWKSPEDK